MTSDEPAHPKWTIRALAMPDPDELARVITRSLYASGVPAHTFPARALTNLVNDIEAHLNEDEITVHF